MQEARYAARKLGTPRERKPICNCSTVGWNRDILQGEFELELKIPVPLDQEPGSPSDCMEEGYPAHLLI